jgi:benzoyl-CoA reductase/2-hydroxyglutaryl-CoA dehydratase subunit BcrC/BadD/HgdB
MTEPQPAPDRRERLANKLKLRLAMTVREIFDAIDEQKERPKSMAYFDNILKTFAEGGEKTVTKQAGQKVVGTYCLFVPEELIYAAGAHPVRLCAGVYESCEVGEDFLPETSCPMVRSEMGLSALPILSFYHECDMVVAPGSCDWKVKMAESLSQFVPVTMLDLPSVKERESSRRMWLEEVTRFKQDVEKLCKVKIDRRRLQDAIHTLQRAQAEVHRLQAIRKHQPPVISGRDALEVLNVYFFDHVETWTKALRKLNDELEERVLQNVSVARPNAVRLLLTGSPMVFPNWKIPTVIEELGAHIAVDEFCTSYRYLHDKVAVDEGTVSDMMHAIADRYLLPCSCPVFSNTIDRRDKLCRLIDEYKVEGVIYHILKGCHPFDAEMKIVEKTLQEKNVPMLKIETDYSPQDVEQLRTRIEAFKETIMGSRK